MQSDEASNRSAIRLCICSPVRLYREGLAESLRHYSCVEVVGALGDEEKTLLRLHELLPEVILLDTMLPSSKELLRAIVQAVPDAATVALAISHTESEILDFAEAGVAGYVTRDASLDDLVAAIERSTRGEVLCSPKVAAGLFRRVSALSIERRLNGSRTPLTVREHEIVKLIAQGLSNKEIASRLYIEPATVKNHVHRILEKLHVSRRAEVAAQIRSGLYV